MMSERQPHLHMPHLRRALFRICLFCIICLLYIHSLFLPQALNTNHNYIMQWAFFYFETSGLTMTLLINGNKLQSPQKIHSAAKLTHQV